MMNYDEMWSLLSESRFEIDSQVLFHVTCVICNKLLIDAYQGVCGCMYCKRCISEYLGNDAKCCPGNSFECKSTIFNIGGTIKDNATNRTISQLEVKCPSEGCVYRSKIVSMTEHLRLCDNKSILCPYSEMGCDVISTEKEIISNHLLVDAVHHNQLMIGWMMNLKNELISSYTSREHSLSQGSVHNLDHDATRAMQNSILDLQTEMRELKYKNLELTRMMNEMKRTNEIEIRQFKEREINQLRNQIEAQHEQICQLQQNVQIVRIESSEHSSNTFSDDLHPSTNVCHRVSNSGQSNSAVHINESQTQLASLVWEVPHRFPARTWTHLTSEYFYSRDGAYKMWLEFHNVGCHSHWFDGVCVAFCIKNHNTAPPWPFKANITITIQNELNKRLTMSKRCKLDSPWWWSWSNEYFHFIIPDDEQRLLFHYKSMSIECSVEVDRL